MAAVLTPPADAPCIVFALRRESMAFRRAFPFREPFPGAPCRAQFRSAIDPPVLMLETGVGAARVESALRWCLDGPQFHGAPYRPRFILSAGFSGALQPGQRVGDLVLATEVVDLQGRCWTSTWPDELPSDTPITRGRLLTVPGLVSEPAEKKRLGEEYQAVAVDMETAEIARLCTEHTIPFGCLRVISDDLTTPLSPQLIDVLRDGRASPWRLVGTVLRKPALIGELLRLAGQTRRAAGRLLAVGTLLSAPGR